MIYWVQLTGRRHSFPATSADSRSPELDGGGIARSDRCCVRREEHAATLSPPFLPVRITVEANMPQTK
jgi:hypothetical protein